MANWRPNILIVVIAGLCTSVAQAEQPWALDAAKIYSAPDVPPTKGKVVIAGDKIVSVAATNPNATPAVSASRCDGGVVVAGFQNSHVHFTSEEFSDVRRRPGAELDTALKRMLTRYGYTTVFDITSDGDNTLALRDRIEKGEVRGPRILTVGAALFPSHGLPAYIAHMPKALLDKFPQPETAEEALQAVRKNLSAGTDGAKLFIATPQGDGTLKRMPAAIASAAVNETHRSDEMDSSC